MKYLHYITFFINLFTKVYSYSEIKLTIEGNGTQKILNDQQLICQGNTKLVEKPDEIYVNDILYNDTDYFVNNLTNEKNNITIRWNNKLKDCNHMFYMIKNIIDIDFSNFDTSEVTFMGCMFSHSASFKSLI